MTSMYIVRVSILPSRMGCHALHAQPSTDMARASKLASDDDPASGRPASQAAGDLIEAPIAPAGHRAATTPAVRQVATLAELTRLVSSYLPEEDIQRIREA